MIKHLTRQFVNLKHQKQGFADNVEVISKASDGSPGHVVREVF